MQVKLLPIRTFTNQVMMVCNEDMEIKDLRRANARHLALKVGGISAFAEKINKQQSQISHVIGEKPIKGIGDSIARQINEAFKMGRGWLDQHHQALDYDRLSQSDWARMKLNYLNASNVTETPETYKTANAKLSRIPLISWVQAGDMAESYNPYQPGEADEWVEPGVAARRHTFALRVRGDSMSPEFQDGAIITVEPDMQWETGDYVIAQNGDNEATFKQIIVDGKDIYLKPLNERYPIKPIGDAHIVGVVREQIKQTIRYR